MKKSYRIITIILFVGFYGYWISAAKAGILTDKLNLSGFLRMRAWYTSSDVKVPGYFPAADSHNKVYYEDLFFRNRININAIPDVEIRTVFDISANFGQDDFSLGNGGTNLVTRDIYAVFSPSRNIEISAGLMPFSLYGGYILARDGTGIRYQQDLFSKRYKLELAVLNAFDNADSGYSDVSDNPDYSDDEIYIFNNELVLLKNLIIQMYYVYEHDKYTEYNDSGNALDGRKASLHWIGIHNKLNFNYFFLSIGGIFNTGYVKTRADNSSLFEKTCISAGLWEFETGWKHRGLQVSLAAEGATGDPLNINDRKSFQDIKASHGFSLIAVDNSGGISIRESGESSWYGLYGQGIRLRYPLFNTVLAGISLLHFRTLEEVVFNDTSSTWFGDECDIEFEYIHREVLSFFVTAGVFFPRDAYKGTVGEDDEGLIIESVLGVSIRY
jgi:hypothetical protein